MFLVRSRVLRCFKVIPLCQQRRCEFHADKHSRAQPTAGRAQPSTARPRAEPAEPRPAGRSPAPTRRDLIREQGTWNQWDRKRKEPEDSCRWKKQIWIEKKALRLETKKVRRHLTGKKRFEPNRRRLKRMRWETKRVKRHLKRKEEIEPKGSFLKRMSLETKRVRSHLKRKEEFWTEKKRLATDTKNSPRKRSFAADRQVSTRKRLEPKRRHLKRVRLETKRARRYLKKEIKRTG